MEFYVAAQPFAKGHVVRFWEVLRELKFHPRPLDESWEVRLNEAQLAELMASTHQFDIIEPARAVGQPFTIIPLDLAKAVPGHHEHLQRAMIQGRLMIHSSYIVAGLTADELFRNVDLGSSLVQMRRNRLAWLSDALIWAPEGHSRRVFDALFLNEESRLVA